MNDSRLTLSIEKPAAGGRMLARHDGRVVLVAGAIPGEQVIARVERTQGGVIFATVEQVIVASPDRRNDNADPACGGMTFSHIAEEAQRDIKAAIVRDAFSRIAKLPVDIGAVHASPASGLSHAGACARAQRAPGLVPRGVARHLRRGGDASAAR